jgi:hypothetical protein
MPSGNATITYTGKDPSITFSGETFANGKPTHSADRGVIGAAKDRDDFTVVDHREEGPAEAAPDARAKPAPKKAAAKSKAKG